MRRAPRTRLRCAGLIKEASGSATNVEGDEQQREDRLHAEVIAEKLGRHRSTILRELRRNTFEDQQIPDLTV
ncbi:helix-turn-helix domain-containing protein [Pararhizobium sp. LjRoot235]